MKKTRAKGRPQDLIWSGVRERNLRNLFVLFSFLLFVFSGVIAAEQPKAKKILIVFSFSNHNNLQDLNEIESRLRRAIPRPIDFYVEYLDGRRLDDKEYERGLVETLGHTYREAQLDLVLIQSFAGLRFAAEHHDELFPGVPIIFIDVDPDSLRGEKMWPGVTGITVPTGIASTVSLALHLHPDTGTVAVITADTTPDRFFLSRIHSELLHYQGKVQEIDLVGLPTNQLLERVAALPQSTIVFFQLIPKESVQPAMGAHDILAWVAQRLPTYSIFPHDVIGHGGIAGVAYDWQAEVSLMAENARRLVAGERAENIPVTNFIRPKVIADWNALQRWHIPESALPPGSLIENRPPTFWERDRNYIIPAIALLIAQALLISGLLWQRTRKRRAEAVLRESEERFRVMADTTPSMIWMCDADGTVTYLNEQRHAFTGQDPSAGYGGNWFTSIHPDDVTDVLDALWQALKNQQTFSKEYRLRRTDGVYRWMFDVASPRFNGDGTFAGFIGSAVDVTDQKLAQQALENVSGQLIEAQENERTRIARDLHDDICQRLALLSMELEQAMSVSKGRVLATQGLEEIRKHCAEIAGDVQSLSHELHSSKLDYLGLTAAIRGFCNEFSKQHGVSANFTDENVPQHLPKDVSLCLFRVAQESLHNAVKHSGTSRFKIELSAAPEEIRLSVTDAGAGFDPRQAKKDRGLGLISMQERVHLVHGKFTVESSPGAGTKILAVVPLVAGNGRAPELAEIKETAGTAEFA